MTKKIQSRQHSNEVYNIMSVGLESLQQYMFLDVKLTSTVII